MKSKQRIMKRLLQCAMLLVACRQRPRIENFFDQIDVYDTPDAAGVEALSDAGTGEVVATRIYGLDGLARETLQRGCNIVCQQMADGRLRTHKMMQP